MNKITAATFNQTLKEKGLTLICAESITAGLLSSTIASISGASAVLKGSIVTYDKEVKTQFLGVNPAIIKRYSAESKETTRAMTDGLRSRFSNSSLYVAVTGVASSSNDHYLVIKEVGQIYVCIWYLNNYYDLATVLASQDRNEIRQLAVDYIIEQLFTIISTKK